MLKPDIRLELSVLPYYVQALDFYCYLLVAELTTTLDLMILSKKPN